MRSGKHAIVNEKEIESLFKKAGHPSKRFPARSCLSPYTNVWTDVTADVWSFRMPGNMKRVSGLQVLSLQRLEQKCQ
jgi:hypothetical protein